MTSFFPGNFDDTEDRRLRKAADDFFARYGEAQRQIDSLIGQASLPDLGISVSLRQGVSLSDLTLSDKALRLTPDRLAHNISQCVKMAEVDYARRLEEIMAEAEGPGKAVQSMRSFLRNEYPDVEPDEEPDRSTRQAVQYAEEDDEEQGWNGSILRS